MLRQKIPVFNKVVVDTSAEDEITKHFPSVVDVTLLMRLNQLCRTHKLSAEQLNPQWEMVCINDGGGGDIKMSMDTIAQLAPLRQLERQGHHRCWQPFRQPRACRRTSASPSRSCSGPPSSSRARRRWATTAAPRG